MRLNNHNNTNNETIVNDKTKKNLKYLALNKLKSMKKSTTVINHMLNNKSCTPNEKQLPASPTPPLSTTTATTLKRTRLNSVDSSASSTLSNSPLTKRVATASVTANCSLPLLPPPPPPPQPPPQHVVVPSWREATFKKSYKLEGTENTSEDVYLKRHVKYENEEIKIKRWDMRRQREEFERNKLLKRHQSLQSFSFKSTSKLATTNQQSVVESTTTTTTTLNNTIASVHSRASLNSSTTPSNDQKIVFRKFDKAYLQDIEFIQIIDEKDIANLLPPAHTAETHSDEEDGSVTMTGGGGRKRATNDENKQNTPRSMPRKRLKKHNNENGNVGQENTCNRLILYENTNMSEYCST